jgi:hypothetical protein
LIKVFIPTSFFSFQDEKELSPLVRPFYFEGKWQVISDSLNRWGFKGDWELVFSSDKADLILFPGYAQHYFDHGHKLWLKNTCNAAYKRGVRSYILISGDFGERFDDISGLIYFRLGGYSTQLNSNNKGFPFPLSDHMQRLFKTTNIVAQSWIKIPIIGFCGHANESLLKALMEILKFLLENIRRFFKNPLRRDYEPFFASGFQRWGLLKKLEKENSIGTNFIYRKHYRAGARNIDERESSTIEYYTNIRESTYILCMRGGGNFSVRLYETLMLGRIPVLINTDCILPLASDINWKKHVIWIDWKDRHLIVKKIHDFHNSLSSDEIISLQQSNRNLWLNELSVGRIIEISYYNYKRY